MKNAVCFFLIGIFVISLLLLPVFVTVEADESFAAEWAACAHHAHGSVRIFVPRTFSDAWAEAKETACRVIPPFLREPLLFPLRAVGKLHALFVEVLRGELAGCRGTLPLS